jgi:hypothetical protein
VTFKKPNCIFLNMFFDFFSSLISFFSYNCTVKICRENLEKLFMKNQKSQFWNLKFSNSNVTFD